MSRLDNSEIHRRIEKLRTGSGMTQPEFAAALGMEPKKGRSTINNWETRANKIKDDDLKKIAETFHVSADWLLGLTDEPNLDPDLQAAAAYLGLSDFETKRLKRLLQSSAAKRQLFGTLLRTPLLENMLRRIEDAAHEVKKLCGQLEEENVDVIEKELRHAQRDLSEDLEASLRYVTGYDDAARKIDTLRKQREEGQDG